MTWEPCRKPRGLDFIMPHESFGLPEGVQLALDDHYAYRRTITNGKVQYSRKRHETEYTGPRPTRFERADVI